MNVLRSSAVNSPRHFCFLIALVGLLAGWGGPARSAPDSVRLRGHVPRLAVSRAHLVAHLAPEETVSLALALPLRDPDGLDTFLRRLDDPAGAFRRQPLSAEQFTERYGPTPQSYAAVIAFARAHGLTVTATYPNRLLVDVAGPARAVEAAFGVHLLRYQSEDGRLFRAPDDDPAIPAALVGRISGVIGLSDAARWHSHLVRRDAAPELLRANEPNPTGSAPDGGLTPSDIKAAYDLSGVPETGQGQTLGLFELDDYTPGDIATYEKTYSLPAVPLQNIYIDGATAATGPGSAADEVTLDLEMMVALAPGAAQILVYEAPNGAQGVADLYTKIASDNLAKEVSTSFGASEDGFAEVHGAEASAFAQMRAQGQSIYAASGDSGAYDDGTPDSPFGPGSRGTLSVDDPASQPDMCGVGGTTLVTNGPGGSYAEEAAWGDPTDTQRSLSGSGGGGGVSDYVPLPDYQTGAFTQTSNPQGSATNRNVPDVSLNANPYTGYEIYFTGGGQGGFTYVGGTSAAAPLWAAFTALVNERRKTNGESDLGFANPTLYGLLATPAYATSFHDIADGSTNLYYKTVQGYDNATGLGSFDGAGLLAAVAPPPTVSVTVATLSLTPTAVVGGLTSTASVTLSGPAPAGGATVTLTSGTPSAATVPASVLVTAGASTAQFTVTTLSVTAQTAVTITATLNGGSASATLTVNAPPKTIIPQSLVLVPTSVCGGDPSVATLTLNGPAPAGGLPVTLTSDNPAATIPASVVIPAGATSATITVQTTMLTAAVVANLSATANGGSATAALTVQAPVPGPLTLNPNQLKGGATAAGTVTLTCPAPPGGASVTMSSDNPTAAVPASVLIPAGATTAPFTVTTVAVAADQKANLTASFNGVASEPTSLVIQAPALIALAVSPGGVVGASSATGTVTLDSPAPVGGLTVGLSSTSFAAAVPLSVVVPAGATSATFTVTTLAVAAQNAATITASFGSVALTQTLTLVPIQVSALTLSQSNLLVGGTATATVTLSAPAPAGGVAVALSSSGPAASLPASVPVPAGATTATVTVTAAQPGSAQIAAALGGTSQTASLSATAAPGTSFPGGLNLLSVPYDYSGQPLDPLFGFAGVKLAVWQPAAGQYALSPTAPADDPHPGVGFWVRLPGPLSLSHAGKPVDPKQNFSIPLQAGWNQIGDPFIAPVRLGGTQCVVGSSSVPFDAATASAPPLLSSLVYRYDQKSGYVWVRSSESLVPGLGYWLYAYQNCTLVVPHP